jgi:hypothetical protein
MSIVRGGDWLPKNHQVPGWGARKPIVGANADATTYQAPTP